MTKLQNGTSQNLYSYNGAGTISAIQHNGFQYDFNYDVFGKLISTKIGNTALSSNTYSASGLLTRTTYANGDYIDYSYDDYDRVVPMMITIVLFRWKTRTMCLLDLSTTRKVW